MPVVGITKLPSLEVGFSSSYITLRTYQWSSKYRTVEIEEHRECEPYPAYVSEECSTPFTTMLLYLTSNELELPVPQTIPCFQRPDTVEEDPTLGSRDLAASLGLLSNIADLRVALDFVGNTVKPEDGFAKDWPQRIVADILASTSKQCQPTYQN